MNQPLILVTNDDGISAPGIEALVEVAREFGKVVVVAPDSPQSGMGHAITVNNPLRMNKSKLFSDINAYTCSGTPVDCVKLGIYQILKERPALVLSGVNHGSNSSTNVLYSGTMSAAVEGAMENIPSIGFSLLDYSFEADFSASKEVIRKVIGEVLNNKFPDNICLNVNIPKLPFEEIKGYKVCRQAVAYWSDRFDERMDPLGKKYYWLTGEFENYDGGEDTDMWALNNGYVSIVPTQFDMTAHHTISKFNQWNFK